MLHGLIGGKNQEKKHSVKNKNVIHSIFTLTDKEFR